MTDSLHLAEILNQGSKLKEIRRQASPCQVSFSAVCLETPQDKSSQTNKKPLNNTGTVCLHKDPEISSTHSHQAYCTTGLTMTERGKMFALFSSNWADHKAGQSVAFTDP